VRSTRDRCYWRLATNQRIAPATTTAPTTTTNHEAQNPNGVRSQERRPVAGAASSNELVSRSLAARPSPWA
jgi:hypothetical protein